MMMMATTASTNSKSKTTQPLAADPKAPSSFLLPSRGEFQQFSASDGIGAHAVETSTLLQILSSTTTKSTRHVLYHCLQEWESSSSGGSGSRGISTDEATSSTAAATNTTTSLEALKLLYAVTHLTETHVLNASPTMADTIIFLRQHFMNAMDIGALLGETRHPEEYPLYWKTLESLILRGCTQDAWHLVSHHSACQRAFENASSTDDQRGFLALRSVLESAPLPGGRTDYDDVVPLDDDDEDTDALLEGVGRLDYQLWTTNPMAAMASWRQWQRTVSDQLSYPDSGLVHLLRREPRLQAIVHILQGDLSHARCIESWSEALCAELLYIRPNLNVKTDLAVRMQQAIAAASQGSSSSNSFERVVISILQGDAGQVVEILFRLGGGSGAALPATMTSLICNYLMDAKLLPASAKELQTQLLCSAADALLSSHALNASNNVDVGMRLVALLLVPHCSSRTDLRITATLANALEHYAPQQDAAAHAVLELVTPLIAKKKSMRILDACISGSVVARYRHYTAAADEKKAMEWLVTGKALEELVLLLDASTASNSSAGTCLRLIEQASHKMSFGLLKLLVGDKDYETDSNTVAAQAMVAALTPGQQNVDAVRLLELITTMAVATLEQRTDRKAIMAHGIADCLATTTASKTLPSALLANKGHCLAPPSMHCDLMTLAKTILDQDEECYNKLAAANFRSSFTTRDMHVLMERQLHFDIIGTDKDDSTNLVLAKGLMRALLAGNAQRKAAPQMVTTTKSMCSTRIESYSPNDQEVLVQRMLDL